MLAVTAIALAACGDDDGDEAGTPAAGAAETPAEEAGEPILIKTHVEFLDHPKGETMTAGEILPVSTIGDSPFCPGGKFGDRHGEPPLGLVVKTIRCPGGRLTITFSPTQRSLKQSADWEIVNGSGRYEGLSGGGRMKAEFESKAGEGREVFTGAVQ
jgi:hypothetical protein